MQAFKFDRKNYLAMKGVGTEVVPNENLVNEVANAIQEEFLLAQVPIPLQPAVDASNPKIDEFLARSGERANKERYQQNLEELLADPSSNDVNYLREQLLKYEQELAKKKLQLTDKLLADLTNREATERIVNNLNAGNQQLLNQLGQPISFSFGDDGQMVASRPEDVESTGSMDTINESGVSSMTGRTSMGGAPVRSGYTPTESDEESVTSSVARLTRALGELDPKAMIPRSDPNPGPVGPTPGMGVGVEPSPYLLPDLEAYIPIDSGPGDSGDFATLDFEAQDLVKMVASQVLSKPVLENRDLKMATEHYLDAKKMADNPDVALALKQTKAAMEKKIADKVKMNNEKLAAIARNQLSLVKNGPPIDLTARVFVYMLRGGIPDNPVILAKRFYDLLTSVPTTTTATANILGNPASTSAAGANTTGLPLGQSAENFD